MMHRFLIGVLFCLILASTCWAQFGDWTGYNANIERMIFQNGVYPTAGYDGCEDSLIRSSLADTTHGDEETMTLDGGTDTILMNWDLSSTS